MEVNPLAVLGHDSHSRSPKDAHNGGAMSTNRYQKMAGKAILDALKSDVEAARTNFGVAYSEQYPAEYRRGARGVFVTTVQALATDAINRFNEWGAETAVEARKTIAAAKVGTAAEESRRVASELRLQRIIAAVRAEDDATGPRVVGGRVVRNPAALEVLHQAERARATGDLEEARLFAEAARDLGVEEATDFHALVEVEIAADDPSKARALRDIEQVNRGMLEVDRDVSALMAKAYLDAAEAAKALGDDYRPLANAAVGPSTRAKLVGTVIAEKYGEDYAPLEGVLSEAPEGVVRMTDEQARRLTHNLSKGNVYDPLGDAAPPAPKTDTDGES